MSDLFDERYRALTPALFARLPDDQLPRAVQAHVALRIAARPGQERRIIAELPPAIQAAYCALLLEGEIRNGGFFQYFWNPTARLVPETMDGLRYLGADAHAALLQLALERLAERGGDLLPYKVEGSLAAFAAGAAERVFDDLDARYGRLPDLETLVAAAIRDHPDDFAAGE